MTAHETLTLATADGQELAASLFHPAQSNGLTLQINGATGVPARYYAAFAAVLAARGFTVLTYDYRGIAGSKARSDGAPPPRMLDWARFDIPAADALLAARFPGLRRCHLGHSFGGQALGLLPQAEDLAAAITIGAQQGYWRHWPASYRWKLRLFWYAIVPGLVALTGKLPGRVLNSEDLPRGVALDWARWCRTPHYMTDETGRPLQHLNTRIRAPLQVISFADDVQFGPRRGVDALADTYGKARIERRHVAPADWGLQRIGHFGFFKRGFPERHWIELADWLQQAAPANAERAA